jgi:hypothetical protein
MVKKEDIQQLKNFKYPPKPILLVAESICLIFSKKPSYENFLKLLNNTYQPFVYKLINDFEVNNLSDYAKQELKNYIENASFTFENAKATNIFSGHLCEWVRIVYKIATAKEKVKLSIYCVRFIIK